MRFDWIVVLTFLLCWSLGIVLAMAGSSLWFAIPTVIACALSVPIGTWLSHWANARL